MDRKVIAAIAVAAVLIVGIVAAAYMLGGKDEGGTVKYLALAPKDMRAALSTNQVDAYIAWEPYVSDSVAAGIGEVLMWTSEIMPEHPCCVVVVSNSFLGGTDGLELTKRFLKVHIEATEWMVSALSDRTSANYTKLVDMAVLFTGRNSTVASEAFEHLEYDYWMGQDFKSALEQFTQMYIDLNITTNQKLAERGYSSVKDFVSKYVNNSLLTPALSVQPSDTILNPDSPIRLGYLLGDLHQMAQAVAKNTTAWGTGKSMYQKYGLNVVDAVGAPFSAGGAEMTAFAAGLVDFGYLGAPPAIQRHLNEGVGTTIIAQANTEGSGIVVKAGAGIEELKDLVNKTVAVPGPPAESSIQFLLLKIALEREGLVLKIKT